MTETIYDVCVIGGGINGVGIARDAAGRGLKVLLLEQGDLAQATSSASTKLIHGGLRYLEYFEFKLVRESLHEREVLLRLAPQIVWPLTFVLPHMETIRPYWMIRAGLFLYDFLAGKKSLSSSAGVSLSGTPYGLPLKHGVTRGFTYADCWADDARLVALNARSAAEKGAKIFTRHRCMGLKASDGIWQIEARNMFSGAVTHLQSRTLVNAAGPWVRQLLDDAALSDSETPAIRLVQGSHIIVPRLYSGDHAYILQQPDGRIVFAIPYEEKFTLIGTTETAYRGDPLKAQITAQEIDYLLSAANTSFKKELALSDVVRTYSGVRPLFDDAHKDAKAVTRDYRLHESEHEGAWLLSVFGGKLTTYRKLAQQVTDRVTAILERPVPAWTADESLPGGAWSGGLQQFTSAMQSRWPKVEPQLLARYARSYGQELETILNADPGADYGEGVCEAELRFLIEKEFARTADDILWRRSKLGLHLSEPTQARIRAAMPALVKSITGDDTENTPRD